jgi:hypothetical protein
MAEEKEKKIIVDEDWKQQAQREKEVLKAQEREEKEKEAPAAEPGRGGPLPQGNLTPEEEQLLKNTLSELRMGYVSVANQLSAPE